MKQLFVLAMCLLCTQLFVAGTAVALFDDSVAEQPHTWQEGYWQITPLQMSDARLYYRAHQSSADYLYNVLGWSWPTKKISPEVNADMVRHHVQQHDQKLAFTYVVRHTQLEGIWGALYVTPINAERKGVPYFNPQEYSAEITLWFTEEAETVRGSDMLLQSIISWVTTEWSFASVLLPINSKYSFVHEQMKALEYEPFTDDAETGELLYRLP